MSELPAEVTGWIDKKRYERLLELVSIEYADLSGLRPDTIAKRFKSDVGHVTPMVGVDTAVFNNEGHLLLVKRSDDQLWALPGGWAELGETYQTSARREVREETGLEVEIQCAIDVLSRMPGDFGQPHTSYHLLLHGEVLSGKISTSDETIEVGYHDHTAITDWHRDHRKMAERAHAFWRERQE